MYRRILVPISRGPASVHGVKEAIRLAGRSDAILCFVHVNDEELIGEQCGGFSGLLDLLDARAAKTVEEARSLALRAGVRGLGVVCNAVGGAPGDLIAAQARAWRADLIVFGTSAVGLRAGSVGAGILGASPVPVFAVSARPARR